MAACATVRFDVKEGRGEGFSGLLFSNRIWRDEKHDRISMTVLKLWIRFPLKLSRLTEENKGRDSPKEIIALSHSSTSSISECSWYSAIWSMPTNSIVLPEDPLSVS